MADTKTSEMEVLEQLQDITECCVCSETYKYPKMLPCIHTFCMKCLEEIGCNTSKSPGDQMPCPMCRKEFTIPEEGYAALQKNFFMEKLIEMSRIASPSEGPDICEACAEGESTSALEVPLAEMYCADCQKKLCNECSRHHRKNKLTRKHQVVAAADLKCKEQIIVPSNCIKHKRVLNLFCSDCKKLLCKHCFAEGHQNHRLQDVRNVVEGFRNEIKGILSGLEVCLSKDLEKKEILNSDVVEYCADLESLKLEVLAQKYATIELVSEHANRVIQDIDQLKLQKRKEVKAEIEDSDGDLTCLESFKVHCAEVMTKGSSSDICCTIDELRARFEDIKKVHESGIEVKTYFRKKSFQMSNLEEYVRTADFNMIGTIHDCQTEVEGESETKTTSDNISPDGHIEMKDDRRMPISGNNDILPTINHLTEEPENKRPRICVLEMEKKVLEKRINERDLELGRKRPKKSTSKLPMAQVAQPSCTQVPSPKISIDYKRSPTLMKTLQDGDGSFNGGGNIVGLTVLDDELFVGCFIPGAGRSVIDAYDIKTFIFKRRWQVKHLSQSTTNVVRISSMVSCTRHKCLYASVSTVAGFVGYHVSVIQRTDVNGSNEMEWKIYGGTRVSNLSVTGEGNVLLIIGPRSLIEYSRDGVLVHEMKLPRSLGIEYPLHILKLTSGNFLVSHGHGENRLHRVLILSESGQIAKSFGEMPVSDVQLPQVYDPKVLKKPVYLAVDGSGNILVADRNNKRIVVLNSNLGLESSINTARLWPSCMCVDDERRRLFVCEGMKEISVFDFSF